PVVRALDLLHDPEFAGSKDTTSPPLLRNVWQAIGWNADAKIDEPVEQDAVLERMVIDTFSKRLAIYREGTGNVINVTFSSMDANKAAKIANTMAETYVTLNQEAKSKSTKIASRLLQDRLTELKIQVTEADRALQSYRAAHNLGNTEKDIPIAEQQLSS